MIVQLELRRFKCFEHLKLPLSNLTVLSGTNASGKSSVLHALALLNQSMRADDKIGRIVLNGDAVKLGTIGDIVKQTLKPILDNPFEIGLMDDKGAHCNWTFDGESDQTTAPITVMNYDDKKVRFLRSPGSTRDRLLRGEGNSRRRRLSQRLLGGVVPSDDRDTIMVDQEFVAEPGTYRSMVLFNELMPLGLDESDPSPSVSRLGDGISRLVYLTAEREGPREVYPLAMATAHNVNGIPHSLAITGTRGEHAVSTLFQMSDWSVRHKLALEGVARRAFERQVEARLDKFFPGCEIRTDKVKNANAVVLGIRTSLETGFLRPIHCGFGITQILPILVAVLYPPAVLDDNDIALPAYLVLIENPEVHLHPSGQALMGEFLAEAAHAGVQIIVETHSDHILNGVRRAVKSGKASADEVAIHFFQDRFKNENQVISPTIDSSGNIDHWPEGFFDQFDKDLEYFAGWGE